MINVEVIYATPQEQDLIKVSLAKDSTVADAIKQSGVLTRYPEIDLEKNSVGIFSKQVTLDTTLNEGDRVEIYRPLLRDPKERRRQKARG